MTGFIKSLFKNFTEIFKQALKYKGDCWKKSSFFIMLNFVPF